jgi:uncharacterized protein (TIGR03437 family)
MLAVAALALTIPLHFESNRGQAESQAGFVAVAPEYRLVLLDTAIDMQFPRGGSLRMNIPRAVPQAADPLPGRSNYYLSADPATWRTGITNYRRVGYRSVFRGVDLAIYGNQQQIEYDWVIAAGADPAAIRLSFTGASHVRVDADGDLVLNVADREIRHRRPYIYQAIDGGRREIEGGFRLAYDGQVRFWVGAYDKRRPLVIDPQLVYAAGFGGTASDTFLDYPTGIAVDRDGNTYVTGIAYSANFPFVHPIETAPQGDFAAVFVAKLSADGSTLLYSTYISIEPNYGDLWYAAIALDESGNAWITGSTSGANFPQVGGGTPVSPGDYSAFVLALDPTGALLASQLFGGSVDNAGTSIALGPDGNLYITGTTNSSNFPTTAGAYRTTPYNGPGESDLDEALFLMKIDPRVLISRDPGSQSPVIYSTYLGGLGTSPVVAVDTQGNAYVAATTASTGWMATPGVIQPECVGMSCANAVVLKISPNGNELLYMTYFGGGGETLGGLAVDRAGNAYICGGAAASLPTTTGAFQPKWPYNSPNNPAQAGFAAKLSPDATKLLYSTYLGGSMYDAAEGIAVDGSGNAYVSGFTSSPDFPIVNAIQTSPASTLCTGTGGVPNTIVFLYHTYCPSAGFLSVLNPAGSALVWSTFLGSATADASIGLAGFPPGNGAASAVALDSAGNVYVTGQGIGIDERILASSPSDNVGVVKIAQAGNPLQFPWDGLTNGASFLPGLPAPGGLASLFLYGLNISGTVVGTGNPLPAELEGVSIFVDGFPAPLLAVASNPAGAQQINFQVPFEAQTNLVEVRYQGLSTFITPELVAPGIFMLPDGSGAIEHARDYSLVTASNPAAPGEPIIIYATGLGTVGIPVADGAPAPDGPDAIQQPCYPFSVIFSHTEDFQGTAGNILYAGLAPGFVGLYQVNVQVPITTPAGLTSLEIDWPGCWLSGLASGGSANSSNIVMLPVQ